MSTFNILRNKGESLPAFTRRLKYVQAREAEREKAAAEAEVSYADQAKARAERERRLYGLDKDAPVLQHPSSLDDAPEPSAPDRMQLDEEYREHLNRIEYGEYR